MATVHQYPEAHFIDVEGRIDKPRRLKGQKLLIPKPNFRSGVFRLNKPHNFDNDIETVNMELITDIQIDVLTAGDLSAYGDFKNDS